MNQTSGGGSVGSALEEIVLSLYRIGTIILQSRRSIVSWTIVGGLAYGGFTVALRRTYTAQASFMPQSAPDANAGLRSLAGQFGLNLGAATAAQSPEFYQALVSSPLILGPIARDSFSTTGDAGSPRTRIEELLEAKGATPELRAEKTMEKLGDRVYAGIDKRTGVITVSVTTRWRPVSIAIASQILLRLNVFNLETRQSQASAERKFIEGRLASSKESLRAAEDALQRYLEGNRQGDAPRLRFEQDRLQREVSLQQQVVSSLAQGLEDARAREVRDTPVITVIQEATARVKPDPRGVVYKGILGALAGATLAVVFAIFAAVAATEQTRQQADAASFAAALRATSQDFRRLLPRSKS